MKCLKNSLAKRRKSPKVSVSTALQKPVKVSISLALTKPDSSCSENYADDEPVICKKKLRSRHIKVPVSLSSLVISSPTKKKGKCRLPQKVSKNPEKLAKKQTPQNESKRQTLQKVSKSPEKVKKTETVTKIETAHPIEEPSVSNAMPNVSDQQRRVNFGNVEVYKFAFAQGHDTVPAKGGVSLGMENSHHAKHLFQLGEYAKYCKAEKRTKLCRWRFAAQQVAQQNVRKSMQRKSKLFTKGQSPKKRQKYADKAIEMSTSSSETEEDFSDEEVEAMFEQCHVYEPMRRALLANCGVPIEECVANESLQVVETRAQCGCRCEGQKCVPELCECALNGIQCQVDYLDESDPSNSFPCSCSSSSCGNPEGRVELDPLRIRNHFLQTLMRLKAAKKKGIDESSEVSSPQHIIFKEEEEEDRPSAEGESPKEKPKKVRMIRSPQRRRGDGNRKGQGEEATAPEGQKQKEQTKVKKKDETLKK